jgi:ABC-type sugar transport system substrate-binding protein
VIVGLDGTPLALDRIHDGTQDASVGQDPYASGRFGWQPT